MPAEKQDLPPRLSKYLCRKAEPFEFYPKRIYGLDPEVRKIFRDLSSELVEWRKAFQPKSDARTLDFVAQPVMLDQFYSKKLLAAVPGFVERTQELRTLTFAGVADPESLAYLREAATCYIHGPVPSDSCRRTGSNGTSTPRSAQPACRSGSCEIGSKKALEVLEGARTVILGLK